MRRLILLLFVTSVSADPVSQHNEPHAGIQAAIDRLQADGCTRYSITRSGQYVLESTPDKSAYNMVGNTITIRCLTPLTKQEVSHLISWQHANSRTDGAPLPLSEVTGYDLEHNGKVIKVGVVTSYTVDNPGSGESSYRIRTCDRYSLCGPWSEYVRL